MADEPTHDKFGVPYVIEAEWYTDDFASYNSHRHQGFPLTALSNKCRTKLSLLLLYLNCLGSFNPKQYRYIVQDMNKLPSDQRPDMTQPGWLTQTHVRLYLMMKVFDYPLGNGKTRPARFKTLELSCEDVIHYYQVNLAKYKFKNTKFNRFGKIVFATDKEPKKELQVAVNDVTFAPPPKPEDPPAETPKHDLEKPQLTTEQAAMAVIVGDQNADGRVDQEDTQPIDKDGDQTVTAEEIKEQKNLTDEQYQEQTTQAATDIKNGDTTVEPVVVVRTDDTKPDDITVKEVVNNPEYKPGISFYLNLIVYLLTQQYPRTTMEWMSFVSQMLGLVGSAAKLITNDARQTGTVDIIAIGKRVVKLLKQIRGDGQLELDKQVYIDEGGLTEEEFNTINTTITEFQNYLATMEEELDNIRRNYERTKADRRIQDVVDVHPSYKSLENRVDRISRTYVRL